MKEINSPAPPWNERTLRAHILNIARNCAERNGDPSPEASTMRVLVSNTRAAGNISAEQETTLRNVIRYAFNITAIGDKVYPNDELTDIPEDEKKCVKELAELIKSWQEKKGDNEQHAIDSLLRKHGHDLDLRERVGVELLFDERMGPFGPSFMRSQRGPRAKHFFLAADLLQRLLDGKFTRLNDHYLRALREAAMLRRDVERGVQRDERELKAAREENKKKAKLIAEQLKELEELRPLKKIIEEAAGKKKPEGDKKARKK